MHARRLRTCALSLIFLFGVSATASAERSWLVENFQVTVYVHSDGSMRVEERISPRFIGSWNGIYRTIPVRYTYHGFDYKLRLEPLSITDDRQTSLTYESTREGDYRKFKIWVPGASDATRTVIITYKVENGIRYFEEQDELYWNITGNEWPVPIEQASADIYLPDAAAGHLRAVAYTGPYGSGASDADISILGPSVHISTRGKLNIREGLTVAVAWDKGVVTAPSFSKKLGWFLEANWIFFVPLGVFAGMYWLWYTRGRDPRLGRSIMPIYEPPAKLTPGEVGTLTDDTVDMRDITATLVDLAVRGYIHIKEIEDKGLIFSSRDFLFTLRKGSKEWGELTPHERSLLDGIFTADKAGSTRMLSALENEFYTKLPGIRDKIYDRLISSGYYARRPDNVKKFYIGLAVGVLVAGIFGGIALAAALNLSPLAVILSGVASAASVFGFGWFMPAKTTRGSQVLTDVLGFEEFLGRAEKDRMERMVKSTEMFEKYLPYAMALGVDRVWARAFADLYKQPPEWYTGHYPSGFNTNNFLSDLGRMNSRAGSAFTSAPRSSGGGGGSWGGSGFGGGGFSGGGGGGGGGGAF